MSFFGKPPPVDPKEQVRVYLLQIYDLHCVEYVLLSLLLRIGDPDTLPQFKAWKSSLRGEMRGLDRQIMAIEREELKIKTSIKDAAKKNQVSKENTSVS